LGGDDVGLVDVWFDRLAGFGFNNDDLKVCPPAKEGCIALVVTSSFKVPSGDELIPSLIAALATVPVPVGGAGAIEPQLENLESKACSPGVEN
jgi:hypothetical protein